MVKIEFTSNVSKTRLTAILILGFISLDLASAADVPAGPGPKTLKVGPDQAFATISDALDAAVNGDTILVYPLADFKPYENVGVFVRQSNLTIRAVPDNTGRRVRLGGAGFDYSGAGAVPRAIVQYEPSAQNGTLDGFELFGAHNDSYNGAGVRINQANGVVIANCEIHDNDMGIMSNGSASATPPTGDKQLIEHCHIFHNGAPRDPGQNHNLYLGGTYVTVLDCEINGSITGHNLKSRAHITRVIDCVIHDAASRELDLVDAEGTTDIPGSDALLLGNVIAKSKNSAGNRNVIHFGQDGGRDHNGTLFLAFNTIVTSYVTPVIDLSSPHARVRLVDNIFWDGGSAQQNQVLLENRTKGSAEDLITGENNFFCGGFGPQGTFGVSVPGVNPPPFVSPAHNDYHLSKEDSRITGQAGSIQVGHISPELMTDQRMRRGNPDIGAYPSKPADAPAPPGGSAP